MAGSTLFSFYQPSPPPNSDVVKKTTKPEVEEGETVAESYSEDGHSGVQSHGSSLSVNKGEAKVTQTGSDVSEVTYATHTSTPVLSASSASTRASTDKYTAASASNKLAAILNVYEGEAKVTQTSSDVSEVTYETLNSTSVTSASSATDTRKATSASINTHKLVVMMQDRVQAIGDIRNLLEAESKNDNEVMAKFTAKVGAQNKDIISKDENIKSLKDQVDESKTKNDDYALQLSHLSSTINELVDSNSEHAQHIAQLKKHVAIKEGTIEKMTDEMHEKKEVLNSKVDENAALQEQVEALKVENDGLKATVEDLQAQNTDYASELENLLSSLKELVDQNSNLETQVEELIEANKKQAEMNESIEQTNAELLDIVDDLTSSLNDARTCHKEDVDQLSKDNDDLKKKMREEEENTVTVINQLDKVLEDTSAQLTAQIAAQKESFEKQVADLTQSLDKVTTSHKATLDTNDRLQTAIEESKNSAAKYAENTAATIGQLEKDLQEDFQIATRFKRGMDELKHKLLKEGQAECACELEDLIGNLRTSQCWQLSRFQLINKLGAETLMEVCSIFDLQSS